MPRLWFHSLLTLGVFLVLGSCLASAGEPMLGVPTGGVFECPTCCTPTPRFTPTMFGDWTDPAPDPFTGGRRLQPIAATYSAFKIAENESPRPQDRLFATYNFYSNVLDTQDIHRQFVGFEKTFLEGNASLGLRVPFFQIDSASSNTSDIDDLNVILKYALVNECDLVLSTGLAFTLPTGPAYQPVIGDAKDVWVLQPFVGYYLGTGAWYVHGFSSVAVPTDDIAPTVLFNDIGIGYWLETCHGPLTAIVPTFEVHVNTPLTHRSAGDPERRSDSVDLTAGAHFVLGDSLSLGAAGCTSVTGPKLFDFEVLLNLNWRF
jgi:hypothetical protein